MKILIGYDGSPSAREAMEDLRYAGLPSEGVDGIVLSAGEVHSLPEFISYAYEDIGNILRAATESAEQSSEEGKHLLNSIFPNWEITAQATLSSPTSSILELAESEKPDLIVLGSHGRGALGRLFLGSVSLRVASDAQTSVRVVHAKAHGGPDTALTILLAFDGSRAASDLVRMLIKRNWPKGTRLHIVTVTDISILGTPEYMWLVGSDVGDFQEMKESRMDLAMQGLKAEMMKYFQEVTTASPAGAPAHEIIEEAKRVGADTIFIGSRGLSAFKRMVLGSVAQGVAMYAACSVEIVR